MKTCLSIISGLLLLASCGEEVARETAYTPVLLKRGDLEKSIKVTASRSIKEAGKIYRYGNLLFINEKYEGVHVYDNVDPTNPKSLGFLKIPGNVDITIKNGLIYADNAVDLVVLTYNNNELNIMDRIRNVFPEPVAPDFGFIPDEYSETNRPANTVIVKWEKP